MWILPSHTSAYAPDTEVLTSESVESLANVCGQSLTVKSKPSRASYFSRAWKAGNLIRLRSGLTSALSLGKSSPECRSSAGGFHVSHFPPQAPVPEMKTRDTSSPSSSTASAEHDLPLFSWRTSKASSRPSSRETGGVIRPALRFCSMCSESWSAWVTSQRQDYSRRQSMRELLTNASGSLSWPTASARDSKGGYQGGRIRNGKLSMDTLDVAVQAYRPGGRMWPTPVVNDDNKSPQAHLAMKKRIGERDGTFSNRTAITSLNVLVKAMHGPQGRENPSTTGNHPESLWATPNAGDGKAGMAVNRLQKSLGQDVTKAEGGYLPKAKLNPRFVEVLMGLPVGWLMPSCARPVTPAGTSSGWQGTASSASVPPSRSKNLLAA